MTAACAPDPARSEAIPTPRAAPAPRGSAFWLAYAAGQEEAVAAVAALAAAAAVAAFETMPMDAWLALSDAGRAAIVAASLAPSGAALPPAPQRGAFDPAQAQALPGAMQGGASPTAACRAPGIAPPTVRRWMAERPDVAAQAAALRPARRRAAVRVPAPAFAMRSADGRGEPAAHRPRRARMRDGGDMGHGGGRTPTWVRTRPSRRASAP